MSALETATKLYTQLSDAVREEEANVERSLAKAAADHVTPQDGYWQRLHHLRIQRSLAGIVLASIREAEAETP